MFCGCCNKKPDSIYSFAQPEEVVHKNLVEKHRTKESDCRITAFALAMISIAIFGIAFLLFGVGSLPPTALFGLGIFPYLGGTFLSFVAIGTTLAALVTLAVSVVHGCQKNKWQEKITPESKKEITVVPQTVVPQK